MGLGWSGFSGCGKCIGRIDSKCGSFPYATRDFLVVETRTRWMEIGLGKDLVRQNAKAVTDGEGKIIGIKILDSGSYYFSTPTILVNGQVHPGLYFRY